MGTNSVINIYPIFRSLNEGRIGKSDYQIPLFSFISKIYFSSLLISDIIYQNILFIKNIVSFNSK